MKLIDNRLCVEIEGASHAPYVGVRVSGLPRNMRIDLDAVQAFVDKRRAKDKGDTPRREPDKIEWVEGIRDGRVTGEVVAHIANTNVRSGDYSAYNVTPRPSHADYAAKAKYGEDYDVAGGGAFSGRMTAPMCVAGAIAMQYLKRKHITVAGGITRIGKVASDSLEFDEDGFPREREAMLREIEQAAAEHDSVGGEVTVVVKGVPAGWGDLMGDSLESRLSAGLFAVPAVKGVSFGSGFDLAAVRGSQANDPFAYRGRKVVTLSNHAGGINGGLANGQDIVIRVAFRPTPSIGLPQQTINLETKQNTIITVGGRHDACVVRRGQYAVLSAVALVIADVALQNERADIKTLREDINSIDHRMRALFEERMEVSVKVGEWKRERNQPVLVRSREEAVLRSRTKGMDALYKSAWTDVMQDVMRASRLKQTHFFLLGEKLPYTHSPAIHQTFGLNYGVKEVKADEIDAVLHAPDFGGCNVTIPYKQTVKGHLNWLSDKAHELNSVNTIVKDRDGTLLGYNTDYEGLRQTLLLADIKVKGRLVAILGTGATAHTAQAVVKDLGARSIVMVSRTKGVTYDQVNRYQNAEVVINTTPVGTYPNVDAQAVDLALFPHLEGVMDLTYNPLRTDLLIQAAELGVKWTNGLPMLCIQAAQSAKLWGVSQADWEDAYKVVRRKVDNLVLIGMPASGKTTVGQALAQALGKEFVDVDQEIEAREGKDIPSIFADKGEAYFRQVEREVIAQVALSGGKVIATGGGAVKDPANVHALARQGRLVWLRRELDSLTGEGRPLSSSKDAIAKLWQERAPLYESAKDVAIDNDGTIEQCVKEIIDWYETIGY